MKILGSMLLMTMMAGAAHEGAKGKVFPYPIDVHDFDNGLRLVGVQFDSPGLAAYYTVVRVGRARKSTKARAASRISSSTDVSRHRGLPAENITMCCAPSARTRTPIRPRIAPSITSSASSRSLPQTIEIEADRFRSLKYEKAQFPKEAGGRAWGVQQERRQSLYGPVREAADTAYDVHPYQHMVIGFLKDIEAMPTLYDYSLEFFDHFYRPEYVTLLVVGDYDWAELQKDVEEKYWRLEAWRLCSRHPRRAAAERAS